MPDSLNGRRWARGFLIFSLIVSLVGNVAHTWLADSVISLGLRVPSALLWPILTFGAIEIVIRVAWQSLWTHALARATVLTVSIPAAVTSYEHLHALLVMMGENRFISTIGPLAIDGMMIGCTLTLLFTREMRAFPSVDLDINVDDVITRWNVEPAPVVETWQWEPSTADLRWAEEMMKPEPETKKRANLRDLGATERTRELVSALCLIQGEDVKKVSEKTGLATSTLYRYKKAVSLLGASPDQPLPEDLRIPSDVVQFIRDELKTRSEENA